MNREEIESKIKNIVADLLCIEEDIIKKESNFINDFNADSLDAVEIIMRTEDDFDIDIADEEAEAAVDFGLLVDLVERKIVE